ncbi:MAG: hypothetical protein GX801_08665 [Fibrobacter sp.]|nr:hypothetical protein [Fibrobacter sp.]
MEFGHGILLALGASLLWGSYTVPMKAFSKIDPLRYLAWISPGILSVSLVIAWQQGVWPISLWGVFDGAYWTIGAILSFLAIQKEGLSGASARWMGTAILVSFVLGVVVLGEEVNLLWALAGLALLLLGLFFGTKDFTGESANAAFSLRKSWRSLGAGLIFGSYYLPVHFSGLSSLEFSASLGVGIALTAAVVALVAKPAPLENYGQGVLAIIAGVGWNLASVMALLAIDALGLAVGFPLTQLALLVSIAWGVIVFGEAKSFAMRVYIVLAALGLLGGAALLGLAKSFI